MVSSVWRAYRKWDISEWEDETTDSCRREEEEESVHTGVLLRTACSHYNSGITTAQANTLVLTLIQPTWAATVERTSQAQRAAQTACPSRYPETPAGLCSQGTGREQEFKNQKLFAVCDANPVFPFRNGNDGKQTLRELRTYSKHQAIMVKVKHKETHRAGWEEKELFLNWTDRVSERRNQELN